MSGTFDRLRLARTEGVGPVTYGRLMDRFGDPAAALDALPGLAKRGGAAPRIPSRDSIEWEMEALDRMGARLLFADLPGYPPLLALLAAPPPVLSVLGDPAVLAARAVAIVGARNASMNGQRIAESLAEALAAQGLVVVSGLARGIDAAAHGGAMRSGRTVAAVAGGLDVPYPASNAALQARIAQNGAVISELPLGVEPQDRDFPRRNRIVAGLSLGVVVIEAAPRSGSLITARLALENGRELFAVPGSPLDPRCRGSNDLIRQGAHLTETAEDVLRNLPDHPRREGLSRDPLFVRDEAVPAPLADDSDVSLDPTASDHAEIFDKLDTSPIGVDEVVRRCQLSPAAVQAALLDLELEGRVALLPGHRVVRLQG